MKLRTKLIITFLILILVPVLFTGVAFYGFGKYQIKSIEELYGVENPTYETFSNTTAMLSRATQIVYEGMRQKLEESPAAFEDPEYLASVNAELETRHSFLVVRKGDTYIYCGREGAQEQLFSMLPEYEKYTTSQDTGIYVGGNVQVLAKQLDFTFPDGAEGSAFIITSLRSMIPEMESLILDMVLTILLVLVFTSVILTAWIYKSIVTPIHHLQVATKNITEGNLDFEMPAGGDDEIGELCTDFEEMRRRLKESAEEKVESERQNKELISNISHDLKTPIAAVKGYVEGLMDGVADTPKKQEKYLRTIYNKANDMDRLINELSFYSKIDTNRIPYTFEKINVNAYFADCVEELSIELEEQDIELSYFNYVEEEIQVIADAEQIKRVINNIVGNSIKYIDKPKGMVNIRVKDVGDFIQVEIEDNGKGIAAKDLPQIFDRFYRADVSRNSSKGGSGIGLSIVKKIVEDHGGQVWATSKEHTGTVMYFVLRKYQEVPIT
ncbi:HAMP domain-containing sensor histidine kinase [Candidatus Merdisoma sp. JLR.KK006]|uniref:HAMP domain-containing sensor histidine kinase n=1 Tax=Candidatus Merdisoma sp. JLR.KK006 TaxID=3112626 RepID=UPI002FEF5279